MKIYQDIDLKNNQAKQVRVETPATLPANPLVGRMILHDGVLKWWDGTAWASSGGVGSFKGTFNASLATMPSGAMKADWWFVDTDGDVNGLISPALSVGDIIVAKEDTPADLTGWGILRMSRGQATTSQLGMVKLATQAEARTGTDTEKAITPDALSGMKASEAEAKDNAQQGRFLTPWALFKVTATDANLGLVRIATAQEVSERTAGPLAVSPENLPQSPQDEDVGVTVLTQLKFKSPDESVWVVTVTDAGAINVEPDV